MEAASLYHILGVERDADAKQLKAAWRALSKECHPDRQRGVAASLREERAERFKKAGAAYAILSDPSKRADYDRRLSEARQALLRRMEARAKADARKPVGLDFEAIASGARRRLQIESRRTKRRREAEAREAAIQQEIKTLTAQILFDYFLGDV